MYNKCNGTGTIERVDWVPTPFGSGSCSMTTYEVCDCLLDGKCPECGIDLTPLVYHEDREIEMYRCPNCGRGWIEEMEEIYAMRGEPIPEKGNDNVSAR